MAKIAGTIYRKTIQRCVDVPKSALPKALAAEKRPPVIVTVNKLIFESTLLPRDTEQFQLVVPLAILKKLRRDYGDTIEFSVKHDPARGSPAVPTELETLLRGNPRARQVFEGLTISMQRQIVRFIDSARAESTRFARTDKAVAMLMNWKTKG